METLVTVLITLGACALAYAFSGVVRLKEKVEELDTLKLDLDDIELKIDKMVSDLSRESFQRMDELEKDYCDRIEKWVASTDRRFDKAYNEIRELDKVVNPNKDLIKNK